jgi:hypothetical protein
MKNIFKSKVSIFFGITAVMAVIIFSLNGCMSMLWSMAKDTYKDLGVYDASVPADQQSELRLASINVKSFNGHPVSWGVAVNNFGYVKVPSGVNTIVFDYLEEITLMTDRYTSGSYATGYTTTYVFTTTTTGAANITIPDIQMLPGHKYFLSGSYDLDGQIIINLQDVTSTPMGFYGDDVPDAPRESRRNKTEFEGKWANQYGETFEFIGNTWLQIYPPYTGSNEGPHEVMLRGTFEASNGTLTLYATGTKSSAVNMWIDIKPMKTAYIYKYSWRGDILSLELPYILSEQDFTKL